MPFPPDVKENALVACGRCCVICHKFCGIKIEVHHIREEADGGPNTEENAIPLCFDCHADMRSYDYKHPKGNKYTETELKRHRNNWYEKIKGNIGVANRETVVETDKQVYQQLVTVLPWDGSLGFIRTNNFAGFSFELSRLNDLYEFGHHCKNPAFEFIDPDLEGHRANLLALIDFFTTAITLETFPTRNVGWNAVPEEWEDEQPDRFHRVVATLHETAKQIVEAYGSLVKTATRKLGLLPPINRVQLVENKKKPTNLDQIKENILIYLYGQDPNKIIETIYVASYINLDIQATLFHLGKLAELDMVHAHYPPLAMTPQPVPYGWYIKGGGRGYLIENKKV